MWGATLARRPARCCRGYFNPRSPCGERRNFPRIWWCARNFNPRSPCGERPVWVCTAACGGSISIHAPRVGSDHIIAGLVPGDDGISIHAPRVGSDYKVGRLCGRMAISIHAPRVGSDKTMYTMNDFIEKFQSTLPVWGATTALPSRHLTGNYFNPRSPCGERPLTHSTAGDHESISIHAPRVGSDNSSQ